MRVVITGPPGCGKSSVIEYIEDNQYHDFSTPCSDDKAFKLVPEVARNTFAFLEEYEPEKMNDFPYRQGLLETLQLKNWVDNPHAIFDRGLPDEFAYRCFFGIKDNSLIWEKCRKHKYDKVFLFPFWSEIYKNDEIRKETLEEAEKIHDLLWHAYNASGYKEIVEVPKLSVEERVKFIYDNL